MPAIAIYSFRRAAFDELGIKDNDVISYSAPVVRAMLRDLLTLGLDELERRQ